MTTRKLTKQRRAALVRDIFNAEHDLVALAEAHGLTPEALAEWAGEAGNQQALAGLCMLADLQTQLLLSRYRLVAATRLIRLATQEEEGVTTEVARKACVDLLKVDLKRAGVEAEGVEPGEVVDEQRLRSMLYGER